MNLSDKKSVYFDLNDNSITGRFAIKIGGVVVRFFAICKDTTIKHIVVGYDEHMKKGEEFYKSIAVFNFNIDITKLHDTDIENFLLEKIDKRLVDVLMEEAFIPMKRYEFESIRSNYLRTFVKKDKFPERVRSYSYTHTNYDESEWEVYLNGRKKDIVTREQLQPGDHVEHRCDNRLVNEWNII